jgi:hypothetical protein
MGKQIPNKTRLKQKVPTKQTYPSKKEKKNSKASKEQSPVRISIEQLLKLQKERSLFFMPESYYSNLMMKQKDVPAL